MKSLENAIKGVGANTSVKRKLRIGEQYTIQETFGPTEPSLRSHRIKVLVQFPDSHLPHNVLAVQGIILTGERRSCEVYIQARLKYTPSSITCQCSAYNWPHRKGGGKCLSNRLPPFCGSCGQPTDAKRVIRTWRNDERIVSECCNAQLYGDCELQQIWETAR